MTSTGFIFAVITYCYAPGGRHWELECPAQVMERFDDYGACHLFIDDWWRRNRNLVDLEGTACVHMQGHQL
jgi:hypothetical protein